MRSPLIKMLSCLACLMLVGSVRADTSPVIPASIVPPASTVLPVATYYLHRVKVEDTSPAEYLWVIDNEERDTVAAKSLASPKLREWIRQRPGNSRIIWTPDHDWSLLLAILAAAIRQHPELVPKNATPANKDANETPDEEIAAFHQFCASNHVGFETRKINQF